MDSASIYQSNTGVCVAGAIVPRFITVEAESIPFTKARLMLAD